MKTIFIPVSSKAKQDLDKLAKTNLPINIAIAYSIQFEENAKQIKEILSKTHTITGFTQVLGCSSPKFSKETKAVLLISSGKFHAVSLAVETGLPIYIWEFNTLQKVQKEEIEAFNKRKLTSYTRFLHADKVGILVSTKPGQEHLKEALSFKNKTKKKSYLFICNNLDLKESDNFGINNWVNTACPRLDLDSSIVNLKDLKRK
jgi:diphthamide biosynthesis enzyme Dph1/Dph2-like protein